MATRYQPPRVFIHGVAVAGVIDVAVVEERDPIEITQWGEATRSFAPSSRPERRMTVRRRVPIEDFASLRADRPGRMSLQASMGLRGDDHIEVEETWVDFFRVEWTTPDGVPRVLNVDSQADDLNSALEAMERQRPSVVPCVSCGSEKCWLGTTEAATGAPMRRRLFPGQLFGAPFISTTPVSYSSDEAAQESEVGDVEDDE